MRSAQFEKNPLSLSLSLQDWPIKFLKREEEEVSNRLIEQMKDNTKEKKKKEWEE